MNSATEARTAEWVAVPFLGDLTKAGNVAAAAAADHHCQCGHVCPRKYHSVAGLIFGMVLVSHLCVNALGLRPAMYQESVNRIHRLGKALPWIESGVVLVPLVVHILVGFRLLVKTGLAFHPVKKHHHGSDARYLWQRVSALVLLAFIGFHVATLSRWGGGQFDPQHAFASTAHAIRNFWGGQGAGSPVNLFIVSFYLIGIAAAVYHLTNGVATSADVWDLTPTASAKRRLWQVCILPGVGLGAIGLAAWYAFAIRP